MIESVFYVLLNGRRELDRPFHNIHYRFIGQSEQFESISPLKVMIQCLCEILEAGLRVIHSVIDAHVSDITTLDSEAPTTEISVKF